jgi:hypothetical protein
VHTYKKLDEEGKSLIYVLTAKHTPSTARGKEQKRANRRGEVAIGSVPAAKLIYVHAAERRTEPQR